MAIIESGRFLDKYTVKRQLGAGGMGTVYLAEDVMLGRQVALKVLHPSLSLDSDFRDRFQSEAKVIASLTHPHIARVYSFASSNGIFAIESEYLEGGSLADVMLNRGLTRHQVVTMAWEILKALQICHENEIVHRDVKPNNILFDGHGRAVLADFGLAKIIESHFESATRSMSTTGFFLGTPSYAPPEAWESLKPEPRWDLYSLGIVMYEALVGHPAYRANSPFALLKELSERTPPSIAEIVPGVSAKLADFVDRAMSKNPEVRPQTAAAAIQLLEDTPEFREAPTSTGATVIMKKPGQNRRWHLSSNRIHMMRWVVTFASSIALVLWLAYVAATLLSSSATIVETLSAASPESQDSGMLTQETVLFSKLLPQAELLELAKYPPDAWLLLDIFEHETKRSFADRWLYSESAQAGTGTIISAGPDELAFLSTSPITPSTFSIHGGWADYRGVAGSVFRRGNVTGSGVWQENRRGFTAQLNFINEFDNSTWTTTVTASAAESKASDTRFIHGIESSDGCLALLYNELVPRKLEWAGRLESHLPASHKSRLLVPTVQVELGDIEIDGILTEGIWQDQPMATDGLPVGELPGRPTQDKPILLVRHGGDTLFIAVRSSNASGQHRLVELVLMTDYTYAVASATRWRLSLPENSGAQCEKIAAGLRSKWESKARMKTHRDAQTWSVEIEVPLDTMEMEVAPLPGSRWRLNCAVYDGLQATASNLLYQWGDPDPDAVEHGAIAVWTTTGE